MRWLLGLTGIFLTGSDAIASDISVAAASHLGAVIQPLSERFTQTTGHRLQVSLGSSGKLTAQITQGAPFDVFLSADREHPKKLIDSQQAVAGSQFTYAVGKLVLWSPQKQEMPVSAETLKQGRFKHLAIANPRLAPYGAAAKEVLQKLGLWNTIHSKLVLGENIAQTHQFVSTRNAELGFVASAQITNLIRGQPSPSSTNSYWLVPQTLYSPLRHDAVLLIHGKDSAAAREFLNFLKSENAKKILSHHGYAHE